MHGKNAPVIIPSSCSGRAKLMLYLIALPLSATWHMRNCHDNIASRKVIIMFSGDSMYWNDDAQFSTKDMDNDGVSWGNCAEEYGRAGWWYSGRWCGYSNLNGVYHHSPRTTDLTGIWWEYWHGGHYSLKATTMMVRKTWERQTSYIIRDSLPL